MNPFFFVRIPRCASTGMKYGLGLPNTYDHKKAATFIEEEGRDKWDNSFTFSFVRNPWERLVSWYFYASKVCNTPGVNYPEKEMDFDTWIRTGCRHHWSHRPENPLKQVDWLVADGQVAVEFVGRFENVKEGWAYVCSRLGVQKEMCVRERSPHDDYRTYYTDETAKVVATLFAEDIETFGYNFG